MNIGIRAHDLGTFSDCKELADAVRASGLDSVQLVAWKALEGVERKPGLWDNSLVTDIRTNLVDAGIGLPLTGAYFNWFASDEKAPEGGRGRQIFKASLAAARNMGAEAVGTETEGYSFLPLWNSRKNQSREAMDHAVEMVRDLQTAAEESDSFIAIEGVWFHFLDRPEKVKELKDRSGADRIRFIFDPVNFLTPRNWHGQDELIDRTIQLYADDTALIHCKDFIPTPLGLLPVPPGKGRLNYRRLIQRLSEAGMGNIPFILEGVSGKAVSESVEFLRSLGREFS